MNVPDCVVIPLIVKTSELKEVIIPAGKPVAMTLVTFPADCITIGIIELLKHIVWLTVAGDEVRLSVCPREIIWPLNVTGAQFEDKEIV